VSVDGFFVTVLNILTVSVPVVYMARGVMILMGANTFRGPLKGWALKIGLK
jgi:hypothetical protein